MIQRISIRRGEITYQEVMRFYDETFGNQPPVESGFTITLDATSGRPDQKIAEITEKATLNEQTAKEARGTYYSFLAGAMLYPILSIADMGTMEGSHWATVYVYQGEGIPIK